MKRKGVIGQTLKPELCYSNDSYKESPGKLMGVYVPALLSSACVVVLLFIVL